jgi:hypothetical protein
MNRKLLPYERGLCEQLDLSEDDYLLFLAAQRDYSLSQEQKLEELRGEPVSIILTVVGILFQVASALLAPKPEIPKQQFAPERRNQRFSPRYGFNSTQELAQYNQPINLVYCNTNIHATGAVRVNTSLLWSSVESTGTGQYMQLLLLVGAASVKRLDLGKTAFGQLPAKQFAQANAWMYYSPATGPVRYSQKLWGDDRDPARTGANTSDIVHRIRDGASLREGYSMAFTPTTATELGVHAAIPINVELVERDTAGKLVKNNNQINLVGRSWTTSQFVKDDRITIRFAEVDYNAKDNVAEEAAKDSRLQLVNNIDRGATYMLGSAQFKVETVGTNTALKKEPFLATLVCTEPGRPPTTAYDREQPRQLKEEDREQYEFYLDVLKAPSQDVVAPISENDMALAGASAIHRQQRKLWLGLTPEQIAAREGKNNLFINNIYIKGFGKTYDFNGTETLTWKNDLDQTSTATYPEGGSLAYSELILEQFLANKPKLLTSQLRDEYRSDLKKLRKYRDDLQAGKFKKAIRNDIKLNDPEVHVLWERIRELNTLLAAANGKDMTVIWRADAKTQPTAVDLAAKIKAKREELESLQDDAQGGVVGKLIKRLENEIEALRERRGDFIDDYIAARREESKATPEQIKAWREEKDDKRTLMNELVDDKVDEWRLDKITETREATQPFTGYDRNRYACGVNCLRDKLDDLSGKWTTDQVGVDLIREKLRALIALKREAIQWLKWLLKNWDALAENADDHFFTKCLVKCSTAGYQTITSCDQIRFNFRVRVFRRISGRQLTYGETDAPDGYKLSDNGLKARVMFFYLRFRALDATAWVTVNKVFAIERAGDQDHYVSINFRSSTKLKREFEFVPISDAKAAILQHGFGGYAYIQNAGDIQSISAGDGVFGFTGRFVALDMLDNNLLPEKKERGPIFTNEWDLFTVDSDTQVQASYDNGPEAALVNVTEQITCPLDAQKYKDMSLLAFATYAANGVQDLRSISAYVLEGKAAWKIGADGKPYFSGEGAVYAPDIFADTVMDSTNGIKNFANSNAVDWKQLALAKSFCQNNGLGCQLFMEGVIADRQSWREFWVDKAPYSLLEFARMNGKETLVPALPVTADGRATTSLTISALFNESNVLIDSYREEYLDYGDSTKDLIATVIYREVKEAEIFPRNASVTLCRTDTSMDDAVWQTFDLSDWVSQKRQAVLFGRLLCQQRRYVGRSIEFKTVPTDTPVSPGAYIYVDIGLKRWDSVRTGMVREGGVLDLPLEVGIADGTYTVMTYDSQHDPQVLKDIQIKDQQAPELADKVGSLFVLGTATDNRRVFRVTEVSLNEEAEVTVRGVEHPCSISGASVTSLVADLSDGLFKEIGVDCS